MKVNNWTQMKAVKVISVMRKMMCCYLTAEIMMVMSVCVNDTNSPWQNMDNYSGRRDIYTGIRRPHNSVQAVTHVVIYLNYLLIKLWYRKMWMRPIAMHSNYKILEAIIFQSPPVQMNGSQ